MWVLCFYAQRGASSTRISSWLMQPLVLCVFVMTVARGQVRYSVPEEMTKGSLVGNIVQDLGLDVKRLKSGRARIFTEDSREYIGLNVDKGTLLVKERIDREELCAQVSPCSLHFQVILENPMELHRIDVEILDINDHAPVFLKKEINVQISELAIPGARYSIDSAKDPDVGLNSLQTYKLNPNDHFVLKTLSHTDGTKYVEMVLQTPLDREKQEEYNLILTAFDGGSPQKTGTLKINIIVLDANDNAPVFSQSVYTALVAENASMGSLVLKVSATDADQGTNKQVSYSFSESSDSILDTFNIDLTNGDITVIGPLDFEKSKKYELNVVATDIGGLTDTAKVMVEITDVNDNAPVINVISFSNPLPENSAPETVIAMLNVKDLDSGKNGQVRCLINPSLPFQIRQSSSNFYSLITDQLLDREKMSEYNITTDFTHDKDYNDNLTFYLVLALAVVSFLFIVSIIAILSVKCYRWRRERMFYKAGANLPVIPYYPPLYADVGGTGTLQHVYNYEVCRTTDSRKSDLKYGRPCSESIISLDSSGTQTLTHAQRAKLNNEDSFDQVSSSE
ncbi:protocadherin beta-1-like [Sinocyclocheilus grahami]|uniref:protocadherin beta-1-like n=1 Tax=Sinocyclocheilus grahami TaxID=75366 RepID=UPI0007ACEE7B|nr:PREDICTED: protocadherin beta-1-like [Sinocyclocheilus grahami]